MEASLWNDCCFVYDLLEQVEKEATERKLRLFGCGCCRLVWDGLTPEAQNVVKTVERYLANETEWSCVLKAAKLAPPGKKFGGAWVSHHPVQIRPRAQAERAVQSLAIEDPIEMALSVARESMTLLQGRQCVVARDIFAYPFQTVPLLTEQQLKIALPLARRFLHTAENSIMKELADRLNAFGDLDPILAGHLQKPTHFKGCWLIDSILECAPNP